MKKLSILLAMLMMLFSTAIPGVYALEDNGTMETPQMDAEQMKEMGLEMIENSIDSLTSLQSELDDDELLDSVDGLLEEMETLKSELEATDDEDEIAAITEEFRTSVEDAPEEIREALMQNMMQNNQMGDGPGAMDQNRTMMSGNESMGYGEGNFPGNGSMQGAPMGGEPSAQPDNSSSDDEKDSDAASDENNGFLSGLINIIKSLF